MKNFYYVGAIEDNGKFYATVITTSRADNLLAVLEKYKGLKFVNACSKKKYAETLCEHWNYGFKANGTYMF